MNGVLVVDKPAGWTSHDVVARVKGAIGARKVGHLGTLDPAATGVLPLVIDRATRFARWLSRGEKLYEGVMVLGVETDTYDSDGKVVAEKDPAGITPEEIERVLSAFRGPIKQVPPMYSAVKRSGTPLYRLARKGIVVEREPRDVVVYALDVLRVSMPRVWFRVRCSAGTYVRSICHDAGEALGCGAVLGGLRRLENGVFRAGEAVEPTLPGSRLRDAVIPLDSAMARLSTVLGDLSLDSLSELPGGRGLIPGGRIQMPADRQFSPFHEDGEVLILKAAGRAAALVEFIGGRSWKVRWVFGDQPGYTFPADRQGAR